MFPKREVPVRLADENLVDVADDGLTVGFHMDLPLTNTRRYDKLLSNEGKAVLL